MKDETFELVSRIYNEFIEFRKETNEKFNNLEKRVDRVDNHLVRLEDKLYKSSEALFDGYKQTYEKLNIIENKVDSLSDKVEKQEVEIKVIKGGRG